MALLLALFACLGFTGLALFGIILIVRATQQKTKMGINLGQNACPRCGLPVPRLRRPKTLKQALWGGSTCQGCGAELDKWGRLEEAGPTR